MRNAGTHPTQKIKDFQKIQLKKEKKKKTEETLN